jgi:hypothetical protein
MPKSTGKTAMIKTLESIMLNKDSTISEKLEACRIWASINQSQTKQEVVKSKKKKTGLLG